MNESDIAEIKKGIKTNRILLIVVLVIVTLLLAVLIAAGIIGYNLFVEYKPMIDELSTLDVKAFNEAVEKLNTLDVDAINEAVKTLQDDMASAQAAIEAISESISSVFSFWN